MEEPGIPPQQSINEIKFSLSESFCEIIYNIVWAIMYWLALFKPEFEECTDPVWFWGTYGKYYHTGNVAIQLICYLILAPLFSRTSRFVKTGGNAFLLLLLTIFRFADLGLSVGLFITYPHRDECPPLTTIISVQFVLVIIMYGLMVLLFCCCFVVLPFTAARQQVQRERNKLFRRILQSIFPLPRLCQKNPNYINMPCDSSIFVTPTFVFPMLVALVILSVLSGLIFFSEYILLIALISMRSIIRDFALLFPFYSANDIIF